MAFSVDVSEVIDRPVGEVFDFYAVRHVQNHPRWDPDIELWLDTDQPLGVGTVIRRRNRRSTPPIEGTMEVVELEVDRAFGVVIHGPMQISGRATFESLGPTVTRLRLAAHFPLDDSLQEMLTTAITGTLTRIKRMLEGREA